MWNEAIVAYFKVSWHSHRVTEEIYRKIGKVYSLEYTDVPKLLFTSRHITLVVVVLMRSEYNVTS
jgi:hypothetical protein